MDSEANVKLALEISKLLPKKNDLIWLPEAFGMKDNFFTVLMSTEPMKRVENAEDYKNYKNYEQQQENPSSPVTFLNFYIPNPKPCEHYPFSLSDIIFLYSSPKKVHLGLRIQAPGVKSSGTNSSFTLCKLQRDNTESLSL